MGHDPEQPGQRVTDLGERLGGPEGLRRLNEAVEAYRQALTVRKRDDLPQDWAMTQNNLGNASLGLGERFGGPEGLRRLSEAVEAYRQALTVYTRDDLPQLWATIENNLGNALTVLGERLGGPGGSAAAERGGGGLPPGPHRPQTRRPAPGLGHDPE